MPVIQASDAVIHQMHGTTFTSYARPSSGSAELCGWRIDVSGRTEGVSHQVSKEEVIYLVSGSVNVTLDGEQVAASAGDVIVVPAGARLRIDNPAAESMTGWVTTSVGFTGTLPDGSLLTPPWTL